MKKIYDYTLKKLENEVLAIGGKKFNAIQIFEWLYKKKKNNFDEFQNISKDFISKLKSDFEITELKLIHKNEGKDVFKYLFELDDGNKVEAVLMKHNYGNSLCVSTQVGCNIGCSFCESGRLKKVRDLRVFEMVSQIIEVEKDLNLRISHVVLMGIGEPFDNYDNVIDFINIINSGKGLDVGARHITVSTSGIVPRIYDFIEDGGQVNLAVSLHAPNDSLRSEIMKINKVYPLNDLMKSIRVYIKETNRRVTFEYIMLKGVNDSREIALELYSLIKGMNVYVNLIPYNETSSIKYEKTVNKDVMEFYDVLKKNRINVTVRKEFGSEVEAACGQLRSKHEEE